MSNFLKKIFKPKHPYAPVAYLGRKTVERSLDCKVTKRKALEKQMREEGHKTEAA
ncbi:hypothetical protein ACFO4O_05330 [Glaciecola siphonariae]|uniref:Uncharacterized protein n=1 Tax=Glaciecola siphonariae TaxID=521012 RepID=A0ABV9LST5_9ALTE